MKTKAKQKAWKEYSRFIRLRDCLKTTGTAEGGNCYTCGRWTPFPQSQAGHFIPGRHNQYLFDERQVHLQDFHCNIGLKGNWPSYLQRMQTDYGEKAVQRMLAERILTKKYTVQDYLSLSEEYKLKTDQLLKDFNVSA